MPNKESDYTSCNELVLLGNPLASAKFARLRQVCGLDHHRAAKMFSLDIGEYLQIERGEIGFKNWQRCMEVMCILSNQPLDLINRI